MKFPVPRLSVRRMMVAVAVAAVTIKATLHASSCFGEVGRYADLQNAYRAEIRKSEAIYRKLGVPPSEWLRPSAMGCGTGTLFSFRHGLQESVRGERVFRRGAFRFWEPMPPRPERERVKDPEAIMRRWTGRAR